MAGEDADERSTEGPGTRKTTRGGLMRRVKVVALLVVIALLVVVVLKNGQQTRFWFFGWDLQMPLALMLLVAFVLGGLAGAGGYMMRLKRK